MGTKKYKEKVREEVKYLPLKFGDFSMLEKDQDVYLGDVLSSDGLSASVQSTVAHRLGRVKGAIYEAAAILKDYRIQAIGGMMGAWDIWEKAIIPKLLANCGSWVGISSQTLKLLEETQNLYCSLVYACPSSTPKPALRGESALLDIEHRVYLEKVCLVTSVMFKYSEEENYARELMQEQLAMGWGGLTREVEEICSTVGLPNACQQFISREKILENIKLSSLRKLKLDMEGLSKQDEIKNQDLRKPQKYMEMISLEDSRLEFRWRTNMLDNRGCMGKKYPSKACPHCPEGRQEGVEETSSHWLTCEAYTELRHGIDPELVLKGRMIYLRRVQDLRKLLEAKI